MEEAGWSGAVLMEEGRRREGWVESSGLLYSKARVCGASAIKASSRAGYYGKVSSPELDAGAARVERTTGDSERLDVSRRRTRRTIRNTHISSKRSGRSPAQA